MDAAGADLPHLSGIYFLGRMADTLVKIGYAGDLFHRKKQLEKIAGMRLFVLGLIAGVPRTQEIQVHRRFASQRVFGEWFSPSPDLIALISEHPVR